MCPDRELLSAWIDGEVPSPWRESLDKHIGACADCSAALASMRRVRDLLSADSATVDSAALSAKDRVAARLSSMPRSQPIEIRPLWSRRYALPLPAIAAAAVVLASMSFALVASGARNNELRMAMRQAVEATPLAASGLGMDSLVDFIGKQNGAVNINITLPAEAFGGKLGEPVIVRDADWNVGSRR
jgi:anti-sigma factor RsiW